MIETLFEDENLWIYDKPAGVSVLRDRSGERDLWSELKRGPKPYLVHRLDKGTSGVWAVAKNKSTQARLTRAFSERFVTKFYLAIVDGYTPAGTHHIDLPLTKGRKSRYRVAGQRATIRLNQKTYRVTQDRDGVEAVSFFRTLASGDNRSLVLVHPLTGRSHQIRVHLAWLGFPIVGDSLYNPSANPDERLYLHAHYLRFPELPPFRAAVPEGFAV